MSDYITENCTYTKQEILDFLKERSNIEVTPYSIKKIESKNPNTYTEEIIGYSHKIPQVDDSFFINLKDRTWFQTSKVTDVEITSIGYILTTLNSKYEVKNLLISE